MYDEKVSNATMSVDRQETSSKKPDEENWIKGTTGLEEN